MQIQKIKVRNMIGARHADVTIDTPITLFCGANGASKSSLQESVRMAFTGKTLRLDLKKEYPLLVSEGAKTGKAVVVTDAGTATFELPSGVHTLDGDLKLGLPEALEYVLNAQAFSSMTPEARRTFLFALTGCNVTSKEVKRRLLEKECVEAKVDMTLALLRSGFPAAADFAVKKATEVKGIWRNLTGEVWGSRKAEGWEAEKQEVSLTELAELDAIVAKLDADGVELQQALGAAKAAHAGAAAGAQELANNRILAGKLDRMRKKLAIDEASLATYQASVAELTEKAGTGPKMGLVHDLARFLDSFDFVDGDDAVEVDALLARYQSEHGPIHGGGDPDAAAKLPAQKQSLELMKKSIENDHRDIASATIAQEWLDAQNDNGATVDTETEVAALQDKVIALRIERGRAAQNAGNMHAQLQRSVSAVTTTTDAAMHHKDIMQWMAIADCLAPDGIPAEMLAQALRPINLAMTESSMHTGWRRPSIGVDMSITADSRPYSLLSKSEKWRVDAIIAEAIAQLSEVRILMLDEVDILDIPARAELLMWLSGRAEAGSLNNVLLFATLKQPPSGLPDNIRAIWLQDGVIPEHEAQQAAA